MVIYNTVDLVKRARQIADLENSDFISYNENIALLNETYQKAYQKLINRGDKSFIKKIVTPQFDTVNELPEGAIAYILPPDFYQLATVTYGKGRYPILRKSKNQTPLSLCYDIVNDELVIYRSNGLTDIEIKYYPVPQTLYLPAAKVSANLTLGENEFIFDCRFNCVLSYNSDSDSFKLRNLTTDEVTIIDNSNHYVNFLAVVIMSPDVIAISAENHTAVYNISEATWQEISADPCLFLLEENGNTGILTVSGYTEPWYTATLWSFDSKSSIWPVPVKDLQVPASLLDNVISPVGWMKNDNMYVICDNQDAPGGATTCAISFWEIGDDPFVYPLYPVYPGDNMFVGISDSGDLYYKDVQGLKCNGEVIETDGYPIGLLEVNYDTGYGILVGRSNNLFISSPFSPTQLDFPQSFYSTYLSYSLAVSYAIKQGKDATLLIAKLQEIEDTFYDTLERDDNSPVRISNVYRR